MNFETPTQLKTLEFYDFLFTNGSTYQLTVDTQAGDTIEFGPAFVRAVKVPKPSLTNPQEKTPAGDITFFTQHIVFVQHQSQQVVPPTPEAALEWTKTLKELGIKTVQ